MNELGICPTEGCNLPVTGLQSHVKAGRVYYHLDCYLKPALHDAWERGKEALKAEQALLQQARVDEARAVAQRQAEKEKATKLAEENARLEKERIAALVKNEKERILKGDQGTPLDRFAIVAQEID